MLANMMKIQAEADERRRDDDRETERHKLELDEQ